MKPRAEPEEEAEPSNHEKVDIPHKFMTMSSLWKKGESFNWLFFPTRVGLFGPPDSILHLRQKLLASLQESFPWLRLSVEDLMVDVTSVAEYNERGNAPDNRITVTSLIQAPTIVDIRTERLSASVSSAVRDETEEHRRLDSAGRIARVPRNGMSMAGE